MKNMDFAILMTVLALIVILFLGLQNMGVILSFLPLAE